MHFPEKNRETKIRKIAAGDEVDVERTELSDESMMEWLDKSNDDLKALIEKAENEAQDAESRAKGKREKKQIKEREEKRQKYLEYHVDQLQLLHRMLAVKLVTAGTPLPYHNTTNTTCPPGCTILCTKSYTVQERGCCIFINLYKNFNPNPPTSSLKQSKYPTWKTWSETC